MTNKGLDPLNEAVRADVRDRFQYALLRMTRLGLAKQIGHGVRALWEAPLTGRSSFRGSVP
jgi:hypothetical protein